MTTLHQAQIECDLTLQRLQKLFNPDRQLTLIVRGPADQDGDIIFTRDDLGLVIQAISRLKDREPTGLKPE